MTIARVIGFGFLFFFFYAKFASQIYLFLAKKFETWYLPQRSDNVKVMANKTLSGLFGSLLSVINN